MWLIQPVPGRRFRAVDDAAVRAADVPVWALNAMAEPFFATLKTEFYYRRVWATKARAKLGVGAWIEDRYNRRRRHSSIGQTSPLNDELRYCDQTLAVQQAAQPRVHHPGSRPGRLTADLDSIRGHLRAGQKRASPGNAAQQGVILGWAAVLLVSA